MFLPNHANGLHTHNNNEQGLNATESGTIVSLRALRVTINYKNQLCLGKSSRVPTNVFAAPTCRVNVKLPCLFSDILCIQLSVCDWNRG